MPAPINTYNSLTDLGLGNQPRVDDPELFRELMDIHNALEILLTASDNTDASFQNFIDKYRNVTTIILDYTIQVTDGLIRVDAAGGDIIVTAHSVSATLGYEYKIKRIDSTPANTVTLLGEGTELIDGRVSGIKVSTKSSYTIKANTTGWDII